MSNARFVSTRIQIRLALFFLLLPLILNIHPCHAQTTITTPTKQASNLSSTHDDLLSLPDFFTPATSNSLIGVTHLTYLFSGANADSISYVRLSRCTSDTCATCDAPFRVISYGTKAYGTTDTTFFINADSMASYLQTAGFTTSATYNVGLYVQSNLLKCNGNTQYCGTSVDTAGSPHNLCIQATYDGAGTVTALAQSDNGTAVLGTNTTLYGYVADVAGVMYFCTMNSNDTGTFNTCTSTPTTGAPGWVPQGVALSRVGATQYAYVPSVAAVYYCTLNSGTGAFTDNSCVTTPASSAPAWIRLTGVAFATTVSGSTATQYAYVADNGDGLGGDGALYKCALNADGTFTNGGCSTTPASPPAGWNPYGVAFAIVNGTQYGYVADDSGALYQCTLTSSNGNFASCTVLSPTFTGAPWTAPSTLAFTIVGGTQYAYVTDSSEKVYQCSINSDGTFNTCGITPAAPSWAFAFGISFAEVQGVQYAYVPDATTGLVYKCTLNANGTINTCTTTTGGATFINPSALVFTYF